MVKIPEWIGAYTNKQTNKPTKEDLKAPNTELKIIRLKQQFKVEQQTVAKLIHASYSNVSSMTSTLLPSSVQLQHI